MKRKEDKAMSNNLQTFTKGLIKENPILVLLLGCCPTLATTTSAINGMSMGLATTFVLVMMRYSGGKNGRERVGRAFRSRATIR